MVVGKRDWKRAGLRVGPPAREGDTINVVWRGEDGDRARTSGVGPVLED